MPDTTGFGSKVQYSTDDGTTWIDVAQTRDVSFTGSEVGVVDVVHNDLANATKGKRPGMMDPQSQELPIVYDKAQAAALTTLKASRAINKWRVLVPDGPNGVADLAEDPPVGSKWAFDGFVTGLEYESETEDGLWEGSLTLQVSGNETFTPAA